MLKKYAVGPWREHRLSRRNLVFIGLVGVIIIALITTLTIRLASTSCTQEYRDDENVNIGGHIFKSQVAETSAQLAKGLGGKNCIGDNQAMLFKFGEPGEYSFWMKDMKFPVDIIWVDSRHQVVQVNANVSPKTYPETFTSSQPAQYVLEIKAGQATKLGISGGVLVGL